MLGTASFKRRALQITALIIVPVVACLIAYNIYAFNYILRSNVVRSYARRFEVICGELDEKLQSIERYMQSMVALESDFGILRYTSSERDLFQCTQAIIQKYEYLMFVNDQITGFALYSVPNDYYRVTQSGKSPFVASSAISGFLIDAANNDRGRGTAWTIETMSERLYLVRIIGFNGAYQMCYLDAESLMSSLNARIDPSEHVALIGDDNSIIAGISPVSVFDFSYQDSDATYGIERTDAGQLVTLRQELSRLSQPLVLTAPYRYEIRPLEWALIGSSFVFLLMLLPLGIWCFQRLLIKPLERMSDTMRRISGGDFHAKLSENGAVSEYSELGRTFNAMMDQITHLKIESYERRMEAQRIELEYYHLQIRPHFYLNCLKILYGMAQCKEFKQTQQLILALSEYLRGILGSPSMQLIETEIRNTQAYIRINNLSASTEIQLELDIDPQLSGITIPSLSVLTFVENSIRHGQVDGRQLAIKVRAAIISTNGGNYANITITDNGPGFAPEQLAELNRPDVMPAPSSGYHIGIYNIRRRLEFVYGEGASITFFSSGGSKVELFLPLDTTEVNKK